MKRFENKVAFITGGNSGIGKASALMIARDGAHIMLSDLREDKNIVKEIEALGVKASFIK